MYYLCSTNIERPYEAALSFLYLLENQLKFPLMCENLPSRKKKLPQRKGFLKPMQDRIVLKSDGKSLHVVPRCKIFSKKSIFLILRNVKFLQTYHFAKKIVEEVES